MSPNALNLLKGEEVQANQRIVSIDLKIAHLLVDRFRIEQNLHRVVDLIIEHADIIVEVPQMRPAETLHPEPHVLH